jgi:hypothetical protein
MIQKVRQLRAVFIFGLIASCVVLVFAVPTHHQQAAMSTDVTPLATSVRSRSKSAAAVSSPPIRVVRSTVKAPNGSVRPDPSVRYIGTALITVRHTGFEPSAISRPAGPVFLFVQNRSGYHEVALRLDRETGSRLYDVRVPRSKLDWLQVVDLQPGRYILTDAYHPDWACTITVTPK